MECLVHAKFAIGVWRALYVAVARMEEVVTRNAFFGILRIVVVVVGSYVLAVVFSGTIHAWRSGSNGARRTGCLCSSYTMALVGVSTVV